MAFKSAIVNAKKEYEKKKKEEEELKNKLVYKTADSVVPIATRNKDADNVTFTGTLLGGISNFTGAGSFADKIISDFKNDPTLMAKAKEQGLDTSQLYTTQENLNMFGSDVKRVVEAGGAGLSRTLSDLGKGVLIGARNMGALSSAVDKAITDLRAGTENAKVEELKLKAKEQGIDTVTLDEYLNKAKNTKTSLELINDFSANTFDKWSNEANQRIVELQNETDNPFTKAVIGFVPNLSQQAVTIGASLINPALGTSVATGQAMGSYYNDAKSRGMTNEQANDFSQIMGIVEGATEMIGVDKLIKAGKGAKALAKGGLGSARKELSKEVITSTFGNLLSGSMDNFIQEALTEPIQEGVADWIGGKGNWENIDQRMLEAGINGAITSLITGGANIGVQSAVGTASKLRNGQTVTQQELNQDLVDTLAEIDKFTPEEKQEFIDKYVTPGIETAQEVTKQGLDQAQNEPKSAVPMQTSENVQQQVQEQEQQVISNQNENALKENVEPQNLVESAERSGIDVKDEKTRKNLEIIQKFNENRGIKATFDADAFKGHDNVNSFFRVDENGNREIVFNPNTKTDKTIEQLAVHEVYHDMVAGGTAQELTDFVVQKMSNNPEYQEYVRALQDVYEEQDSDIIKEEAVAHYLEKNLGTDEFISELQQRGDRTTIQRIIDTIKDMITKAKNTLTGKGDLNYLLDLQRKYEQAYNGEFKGSQEQTKLSKQVDGNETEPIKVQYKGEEREYKNYYDYMKDISENEEQLANNLLFKHNSYDFEIPTSKNETSFYHGTDYSGYYKDLNLQDYGYGMDRNYGDYFYVTSDKTQTTPYGKQIAQFIIPNDKILSLEEYRKMGNVSDEELFNKYLAIEMPDNEYIIKDIDKVKEYTLDKAKEYIKNKDQQTQPTTDNQGRTLTKEQQDYFKDSKVRDENGNLLEVYHGTKTNGINVFKYNPKNQTGTDYGKAFYFTSDYTKAQGYQYDIENDPAYKEYSKKDEEYKNWVFEKDISEEERSKRIKEWSNWHEKNSVFDILNNENFTPERLPKGETKKAYLNLTNPYIADAKGEYYFNVYDKYFKEAKENGNDGIIVKNVIDVARGEHKPIDVYIAFNENQIKNVDNANPTESPDIRYSKEAPTQDNQGRELSKGQQEYFRNSKVRDENGNLMTVYHGTAGDFTVFNKDLQVEGDFGRGFYFTDLRGYAEHSADMAQINKDVSKYKFGEKNGNVMEVYLDIEKPVIWKNYKDYQKYKTLAEQEGKTVENYLRENYDGIIVEKPNYDDEPYSDAKFYVVFEPNQIKNVDNTNPTENVDIRYQQQGTGTSQEIINNFLENTKVNEGTGTAIKDLARVPVPKTDYKALLQPQLDRLSTSDKAQMSEIIDNLDAQGQLNEEAYNSALETINALQEVSQETTPTDELSVNLRDGKFGPFDSELRDYRNRYDKGQLDYNKDVVNSAMELVPGKKIQGQQKRTKAEWLRIAQHIGQDIANLSDQQVKDTAYATWLDLAPNNKNTLNREGGKYVDFKSQEWNNAIYDAVKQNRTEITETEQTRQVAPDSQVTTQDYLTHHPDYYDGDQFDFNAHRTEVINKANQDIVDIIKNSSNLREDLQRAYDLNEKNDVEDIKTGQDEDNRLTYQHKETILSSLLRSKDIENSDLYKSLMEDTTPRQVAPSEAPAQVPQQDVAKERVVEPIKDITDVERPQIPQGNKVRKTYESIINSNQMTQEAKQIARELMGYDTYEPQTNKLTLAVADKNIEQNGVNESLTTLTNKVNNNDKISAVDIAMGERLIQYYSKTGDRAKLQEAIQTTAMAGTEAGRAVQAMAMLNHQTPTGQVTWIQRSIDKVNKRLAKEGKPQFNFTPEMQQKILNSTQENLQKNLDSVYRELGQQVPKSAMEKFNEWRYFSMLANPKTHIRNILGNVVMGYVQRAKNKVAGTIEDFVIGDNAERWNSLKGASKGMYEFAKNDLKNADVQSMLGLNENKYNPQSRLQQNQRTFKNKFLEGTLGKLFDLNSKALEVEDGWGLKSGYAKAMANYLNANNLDYNNLTDTQLQKARQYAVEQAKEATFHQDNSIANMLQTLENKNLFTKIAVGGAIPFKKTPMNVALTGFEYSPAGFVKTLTTDLSNLKKGKISANQFIDNISKNLTGTGITLVGYALTQAGILKASGSGDEDKDEFEEATGKQNYSIQIGDNTYSLDWLTPAGIPLFIGSELYQVSHKQEDGNKTKNENESLKAVSNILDATASAMNPMSEMTMISSLTSALKSYASGNTKSIENMLANVGKSYVTQSVPTALGQIARSTDEYERSTTSTETDPMAKAIDSAKNQIVSKIPGLRKTLPVSTDVWGNERKTQDLVSNAVLPWTKKEISQDPVNKALTDLYDATGEGGVLPDNYIDKTLTIDKEKYKLTNEEYAELKQQYGKTSHDILSNLTNTSNYNKMTDEQKVKAVKEAYSYAKSTLKVKYSQDNDLDAEESATYKKVQSVINNGGDAREYFEYVGLTSGLDKDKDKMKALQNSSIKNKGAIYESTIGKNDETYQIMKNAGINANAYLDYKQQEFKTDKENDYSAKNQFYDYMDDANMTYEQKLLLTGMKYKLNPGERDTLADYIESLPISAQEKTDMFRKLKGCKINEYGEIYY